MKLSEVLLQVVPKKKAIQVRIASILRILVYKFADLTGQEQEDKLYKAIEDLYTLTDTSQALSKVRINQEALNNIGVDLIEKHFPKGKCKERGAAIVMYAEWLIALADSVGDWVVIK